MTNKHISHADSYQIQNRSFDDKTDSLRVSIVSGEVPKLELDGSKIASQIADAVATIKWPEMKIEASPRPTHIGGLEIGDFWDKMPQAQVIEVPKVIIQTEYKEIEKPVIVREVEIREVIKEVPVYLEKVITVEKPVIVTQEKFVEVPKLVVLFVILQALATLGVLIVHLIK